ncbi:Zinc finger protein 1 protein [Plakobranchus ocellatus]|uniref:Zinc finger protein 1 protein n=1 Tax=Plakobranchus ocellatus TaxID=259542 RepID=A0AAV3XT38_9GAST|nr:Zinc finger protein 1 protein [Plakobranchus ocellatus]
MDVFKCEDCPAVFSLRRNLTRHVRQKHSQGEAERFICDDCGASFSRFDNLNQHLRERHTDPVINFLCERCGLGFSRHRRDAVSTRKDARKRKNARQGERVPKRRRHVNDIFEPYRPDIVEDDLEVEAVDNIISLLEEDGVREIYRNHWTSLRTHYREGPNHSHYTFRWDSQTEPLGSNG